MEKIGLFKMIKIMRFTIFILFLSLSQTFAVNSYSQQAKLSLDMRNVRVEDVIDKIEKNSEFFFMYNKRMIDVDRKIDIQVEEKSVNEVLDKIFANTDISYSIKNRQILLINNHMVDTGNESIIQQQKSVSGKVTDSSRGSLPGVSVVLKGTTTGTITDSNGIYTITNIPTSATLLFSFVGMKSQEIIVGNKTKIDIVLDDEAIGIEEVVAVGYGTMKKGEVTSSITSIKSENFIQGAVSNPLQLVQGKVPGLTISRQSDDPNAGLDVLLRGVSSINASTTPLIIVDGVPGVSLSSLSNNDIESIDVLKDGSAAAIYGTRGTNGVIIVTTKSGKKETNKIEYDSYLSIETVAKKLDTFNANEYKKLNNSAIVDYGSETNWINEMIRKSPMSNYHNVSLIGGSSKTNFRLSFNYKDIIPIAKTNSRNEYGVRANIRHLALDDNLSITSSISTQLISGSTVNTSAFEEAIIQNPTMPLYDPINPSKYFEPGGSTYNPVASIMQNPSEFSTSIFTGNVKANLKLFGGLETSVLYGLNRTQTTNNSYSMIDSYSSTNNGYDGKASKNESHNTDETFEFTFNYNLLSHEMHRLSTVAGYSYQRFITEGFNAINYGFLSDGFLWNNLNTGTYLSSGRASMGSDKSESKLIAFFARANYSFSDKYLFSASVRREGSTKFGANNKWGIFPATSIGWRISKEGFMSGTRWLIDDLKLRAGFGVTGNQGFDSYKSISTFAASGWVYDVTSGTYIQGYGPNSNPNPSLKWEKKYETNLGIDFSVLKGRISGTIDLYKRITRNLLYNINAAQPPMIYSTILDNIGELNNKGIEITINAEPIKKNNFSWNTTLTWSTNSNKVIKLTRSKNDIQYLDLYDLPAPGNLGTAFRLEEGGHVSQFYGYRYAGLTDNGEWLFYSKTGEKLTKDKISTTDKEYIGNGLPLMNVGWNNTFIYKKFDLTLFFRGDFKFNILNMKDMYYGNKKFLPYNLLRSSFEKNNAIEDNPVFSDYYLEKGDYLKLDNLTAGYNFDCSKVKYLERLRVYFSARNVFVITKYSGLDPEVSGNSLTRGVDARTFYPRTRTWTVGLSCTF